MLAGRGQVGLPHFVHYKARGAPLYVVYIMSCHVMSCHVMSCHVLSCLVLSSHVMLKYHIKYLCILLYHVLP